MSVRQGRDKVTLVTELLQRYVEAERLREALLAPQLIELHFQLADEGAYMAEEGMDEYHKGLADIDHNDPR